MNCKNQCQSFTTGRQSWASPGMLHCRAITLQQCIQGYGNQVLKQHVVSAAQDLHFTSASTTARQSSAQRRQLSGACSPAHGFGIALPAAAGGVGGCGEVDRPQSLNVCCRDPVLFPPNSFVCSFGLFFCSPAFFAIGHLFAMCWIKHKSHRNDFKVPSTE